MSETSEQEKIKNIIKVRRAIYFSFLATVFIYPLVLLLMTSHSVKAGPADILKETCIVLSVLAGAVKFWLQLNRLNQTSYYEKCQNLDEITGKYQKSFVIILFLCLVPAVSGLVLAFSTFRITEYWPFMAASLFLFGTSFPRPTRFRAIVENHAARCRLDQASFVGELKTEADFVEEAVQKVGDFAVPSLFRRMCAFLIDLLLIFGACILILKMPTLERYDTRRLLRYAYYLTVLFFIIYNAFIIRFYGRTVGCLLCGLRIISITKAPPNLALSLTRGFVQLWMVFGFFPLFLLGECVIFLIGSRKGKNPYKRTTWDRGSATIVVRTV